MMNATDTDMSISNGRSVGHCPRCGEHQAKELERLQPDREHVVLRCRCCGHLWAPQEQAP